MQKKINYKKVSQPKSILDMSSKRKSQPTRIRDQQQEHELSPIPSPEMTSEKGLSPEIRTNLIAMKNKKLFSVNYFHEHNLYLKHFS